ncbi:hypothetical protein EJB05_44584 [Eragrostis curvula]|uniref:Uncharacterized protein n=1 Tax=Eragrostis curvula TaxID=38414 RepID=A0A5J9TIA2_9POAL|nr:hypothetical protein EJB05_44584 [Eragrostis curvula]
MDGPSPIEVVPCLTAPKQMSWTWVPKGRTRLLELEGTINHSPAAAASIEGLGTSSSSRKLDFEENTQKLQPSKKKARCV